ncbi:M48 family metallopeptidase [Anaeromyxobacter diazotrophicus]|uniref:Peptidase M48 n=1 Tax=Anaeromyxobacter diazotrophicus TaxID=2590199 RepID=A0A7I9VS59_9BACT|nr:M48 family metallopeptidase [Anaeromyxobacter diazotrophicus]GEJ59284.1 peptidase M48 [Anaeromyxobacter diazotrophicus]
MTQLVTGLFLAFFLAQLAVESGLALANLRHVARAGDAVPPPLAGRLDPDTARRSRAYTLARGRFGLAQAAWGTAVTLALLFSGVLPALDAWLAGRGLGGAHRFAAFLAALAAATALLDLPFSLYSTFALEQRFGFNRATPALWLKDRLKGLLLAAALGLPLLYATYGFFALTGRAWWLWLFAFLAAVQIALVWLYPTLIAPLFNRFAPLPEGPLRARLEEMARQAGFATRGLYVMDASRRSGHSNAYFTGFFRPRIVLFDTLVAQMTVDETAAVLAHEIGHYQARHVHRRLALGLGVQLASLAALAWLVRWPPLFQAFGFAAPSLEAAVALASLGGGAFTFFLAPLSSFVSRRHEYEADRRSVALARAPAALASALVKLNRENLSNLHPHPWYSAWHYSHPTLLERLAALEALPAPAQERAGA